MIVIEKSDSKAVMSDGMQTGQFRIKESAKAFSILSSSLYSNPIAAIIRELSCNARDSHKEAVQEKPFFIHIPTTLEPEFYIRDFGVGLGHEQVMNLYTTYFESTKTNSNDFVGALGLGSKSPFSYTDNFTVTAIKGGVKGIYTAFINDEGTPSIARMVSTETDEESGVEVRFAVQQKDHNSFKANAVNILGFFEQLPDSNVSLIKVKYTKIYGVDTSTDYSVTSPVGVVMGGIYYPVQITKERFGETIEKTFGFTYQKIVISANIGDVDMQPSREGLTYTKKTTEWIRAELFSIIDRIEKELDVLVSDSSMTDWDKISKLSASKGKNVVFDTRIDRRVELLVKNAENISELTKENVNCTFLSSYSYKSPNHYKVEGKVQPYANSVVLYNDTKRSKKDIYETMRSKRTTYYLIDYIPEDNPLTLDQISQKYFYGKQITKVSDIGIHPKQKNVVSKEAFYYLDRAVKQSYYSRDNYKWVRDVGTTDAKYYVELEGQTCKYSAKDLFDIFGRTVIGITKSSKFDKSNLINVEDYIDNMRSSMEKKEFFEASNITEDFRKFVRANKDAFDDKELSVTVEEQHQSKEEKARLEFLRKYRNFVPNRKKRHLLSKYAGVYNALRYTDIQQKHIVSLINSIFKG